MIEKKASKRLCPGHPTACREPLFSTHEQSHRVETPRSAQTGLPRLLNYSPSPSSSRNVTRHADLSVQRPHRDDRGPPSSLLSRFYITQRPGGRHRTEEQSCQQEPDHTLSTFSGLCSYQLHRSNSCTGTSGSKLILKKSLKRWRRQGHLDKNNNNEEQEEDG